MCMIGYPDEYGRYDCGADFQCSDCPNWKDDKEAEKWIGGLNMNGITEERRLNALRPTEKQTQENVS